MINFNLNSNLFRNILFISVIFFPLSVVLRSFILNMNVLLISSLIIFFILNKKNYELFNNKFVVFLLIFFSYIFLNSIYQFEKVETIIKTLGNFRYILLTLGVIFFLEHSSQKNKKFFLYLNLSLILLIGLDIIYQYNFYQNIFGFPPAMCNEYLNKCTRFSGVFDDELIAGAFVCQIGLICLFLMNNIKIQNNRSSGILKLIFGIYILIVILLTGERNALLIFLINLFFFFYFNKKIIIFLLIGFFIFSIIYIISLNSQSVKNRYVNILDSWGSLNSSTYEKIVRSPWSFHYQAAYELFLQKPIFGHGPKSFRNECKNTKIEKELSKNIDYAKGYKSCSTHPHNYMMEFLSENGAVGLIFYLSLFFTIFIKLLCLKKKSNLNEVSIVFGIGGLLLAIMFPFKPSGSFFTTFNASIFFYIFGFFVYYLKKIK